MFVTAPEWKNRLLGTNISPTYPHQCVVLVTGNGLAFSEDIVRRICFIRLDAKSFRPYDGGRQFKHPDLLAWIRESKGEVLGAIFTLARAV
jgi:hypothetical protein